MFRLTGEGHPLLGGSPLQSPKRASISEESPGGSGGWQSVDAGGDGGISPGRRGSAGPLLGGGSLGRQGSAGAPPGGGSPSASPGETPEASAGPREEAGDGWEVVTGASNLWEASPAPSLADRLHPAGPSSLGDEEEVLHQRKSGCLCNLGLISELGLGLDLRRNWCFKRFCCRRSSFSVPEGMKKLVYGHNSRPHICHVGDVWL